jgi:hypothetical protein
MFNGDDTSGQSGYFLLKFPLLRSNPFLLPAVTQPLKPGQGTLGAFQIVAEE